MPAPPFVNRKGRYPNGIFGVPLLRVVPENSSHSRIRPRVEAVVPHSQKKARIVFSNCGARFWSLAEKMAWAESGVSAIDAGPVIPSALSASSKEKEAHAQVAV